MSPKKVTILTFHSVRPYFSVLVQSGIMTILLDGSIPWFLRGNPSPHHPGYEGTLLCAVPPLSWLCAGARTPSSDSAGWQKQLPQTYTA